jgi:2,4-dichlorophenol 6-monooxygenase
MNHANVGAAMGFFRGASEEANLAGLRRALGDAPEDVANRRAALAAIATQSMEFREHHVEYGQRYASAAIVADGSPEPRRSTTCGSTSRARARAPRSRIARSRTRTAGAIRS